MFGSVSRKGPWGTPLVMGLVLMVSVLLETSAAALPRAESLRQEGAGASSAVGVAARARTSVVDWSTRQAVAASTVPLRVPVTIRTGDQLVSRMVSVQRRAVGAGKWKTVRSESTTAAGTYTAVLTAGAGSWEFRLRVKAGAGARSGKTKPRRVVVTRLMVATGAAHTCALRPGGTVRCWGSNEHGQLGDGTRNDRVRPVTVKGITGATTITAGDSHTCALLARGRVVCWGHNSHRQLGITGHRDRRKPVRVQGVQGATAVTAGVDHTCAVLARGRVTCWGWYGQVDDDKVDNGTGTSARRVPGLTGVTALAGGAAFDCALDARGRVRCWGRNWEGQLGDATRQDRTKPVAVRKLGRAGAIAAGGTHACAVVAGGRIACWGTNTAQGLARTVHGETVPALLPVRVEGLAGQVGVTAGEAYTCASDRGGRVHCLGSSFSGQLGDGLRGPDSAAPVQARGVWGAVSVSAANTWAAHTCAQLRAGPVKCWGDNSNGQLGDGTRTVTSSKTPVEVHGLTGVTALGAGASMTCAVGPGGTVSCWGFSGGFNGSDKVLRPTPVRIPGLSGVTAVAGGFDRACALLTGGTVTCWDGVALGKLVPVPGISGAIGIAGGWGYHCALRSDGGVACWDRSDRPSPIRGISGASAITLNELGGCAVVTGGNVSCWTDLGSPATAVAGVTGATAVAWHYNSQLCVVQATGSVTCWFDTADGQREPLTMSGIRGATAIGAGYGSTCALPRAGTVRCWQIGDGPVDDSTDRSALAATVAVPGLSGARAIGVGGNHACAARADGTVACWGDNEAGQLGMDLGWLPRPVVGLR